MQNNETTINKQDLDRNIHLPCRGCTRKCTNYHRCNGKPWRLTDNKLMRNDKNMILTIFYDSHCPLCQWEMRKLKQHDINNRIELINIHDQDFNIDYPHIDVDEAMSMLHGQWQSGEMLYGLDVTVNAWQLTGKHTWLKILRWPVIRFISDYIYRLFARHRNKISYLLTGKRSCSC